MACTYISIKVTISEKENTFLLKLVHHFVPMLVPTFTCRCQIILKINYIL